jgi:hypothetical protein
MSQLIPSDKNIGAHKYEMNMMPPRKSHRLLVKLVKMIGPSLGPVFDMFFDKVKSSGVKNVMDQEIGAAFFTKAIGNLCDDLDNVILDEIIDALADTTHVDGKHLKPNFDAHFLGNLGEMYQWLAWGMSVQWGKSLTGLVELMPLPTEGQEEKKKNA